MKKNFLLAIVFFICLFVILFYINRNSTIIEQKEKYLHIQQVSYELIILIHEQQVNKTKELEQRFEDEFKYFVKNAKELNNPKINKVLNKLQIKSEHDLVPKFNKIILHTARGLNKLRKETSNVIIILLSFSLFMLVFILYVYSREVLHSREMRRLRNELQQFVDAINESAIVSKTDLRGMIIYANDQFCQTSQYSREELIGQPRNIVRHKDMPASVFKEMWETIKDKKVFKGTIKNRKKDGSAYYVDSSVTPILDVYGNIEEYLAVRYEVTELIKSRDMAIVAEKSKSEFLSNMSHELRTPLNSIHGFSAILSRKITDKEHLKYLQNIMDSSDNLIGLINDILDLSKLQSGKFSLDYHRFNLKEKINLLLERFDTLLDKSALTMHRDFDESIQVNLNGDWLRISQIITNLLSNAIKFSPKDKAIDLSVKYENSELIIIVVDRGIGMSQEAQDKIFKPFEQADSSTTRKYGGTGLGLSIVLNLIEQMKGTIELQSQEGKGSKFKVVIPLKSLESKELLSEKVDEGEIEREAMKGHILIAEDNKTNQMLVGILMEEFGLSYKIANDGVEAVDMFSKEKFDLVLMDENMPNMGGTEAMQKIHSLHGKDVPIVALTANAMNGDRDKFLESGMSDYVSKPIDDDELYKVMNSLLKK